jgi:L-threonylcarbamoyladenylate synthase
MGKILKINPHRIKSSVICQAAEVIQRGGVILYPTDTIYGLGCDALNVKAVKRIYKIKHRSENNPALVLVHNKKMLNELVDDITPLARGLMKMFWPGPLTIIFRASRHIHQSLISQDGKIGIRMPRNKFCLKLIAECEAPLLSTSANISGSKTITTVDTLKKVFTSKVDLFIDAGDLDSALPSTVVDVSGERLVVIREGAISSKQLLETFEK